AGEALGLGLALSGISCVMLGLAANWFAGAFLAFTIFFYVVVYTIWLKRTTPQNIVIGGAAGAFPPMIGWAVATGGVSLESLLMFALIFMWTPPHFWALALFMKDDYSNAGVPMLTVTHGRAATRRHILAYTLLLAPFAPRASACPVGPGGAGRRRVPPRLSGRLGRCVAFVIRGQAPPRAAGVGQGWDLFWPAMVPPSLGIANNEVAMALSMSFCE